MRHFIIALQFMTVIRFRNNLNETAEDMASSVGYYPLVGLVLGGLLAVAGLIFNQVLTPLLSGLLLTMILALLTQGLHLDGLADTADGLFSHRSRERKLEIMKDSAVGGFGALAMIFIVLLKTLLLANLVIEAGFWRYLILFPLWGRLAASLTTCLSHYARPQGGLGKPFVDMAGDRELAIASIMAVVLSLLIGGPVGAVAALIVALIAVAGVKVWSSQIGGVTGDILGATVELGECLGLLAITVWLR